MHQTNPWNQPEPSDIHKAFNEGQQSLIDAGWVKPEEVELESRLDSYAEGYKQGQFDREMDMIHKEGYVNLPSVEELQGKLPFTIDYGSSFLIAQELHDWLKEQG